MSYVMISNQFLAAFNLIKCFGVISILSLYPFLQFFFSSSLYLYIFISKRVPQICVRVVCPNFGHPALTFQVYALCRCCRHATKIINHHSKVETISKMTVHLQLLQNYFTLTKIYIDKFRSQDSLSEVRAHYPTFFTPLCHKSFNLVCGPYYNLVFIPKINKFLLFIILVNHAFDDNLRSDSANIKMICCHPGFRVLKYPK